MKTLLSILAIGALASSLAAIPAQAQSVTITTGNGPGYHDGYHHHRWYPEHRRGWEHSRYEHDRYEHDRCMTKTVKSYHNGHTVIKQTRACR